MCLPRTLYWQEAVKFMKGFQLLSGLQCRENVIQDDQSYSAFVFLKLYGTDEFNQIVS